MEMDHEQRRETTLVFLFEERLKGVLIQFRMMSYITTVPEHNSILHVSNVTIRI